MRGNKLFFSRILSRYDYLKRIPVLKTSISLKGFPIIHFKTKMGIINVTIIIQFKPNVKE